MRRWIAAATLLVVSGSAYAGAVPTWMSVTLDGRKVGNVSMTREVDGATVTTTQTIDYRVKRWKTDLPVRTEWRFVESADGRPLSFAATASSSGKPTRTEGFARPDGSFQVTRTAEGETSVDLLAWPQGATLSEGQRLAIVHHGFVAGTTYDVRAFDVLKQQVATLRLTVVGDEVVELPGGTETLHHLREALASQADGEAIDLWVDDHGDTRRSVRATMGARMELAACDEACAHAPDQDMDILRVAMVGSPRMITQAMAGSAMRYTVTVPKGRRNPFVETGEQHVEAHDYGYEITIGAPQAKDAEPGPGPVDMAANPWVQSTAPEIVAAAREAVGNARNDRQRVARLRSFVTDTVEKNDLGVGYASALDTLHSRRGDCTEHAVLLAALVRSLGIPARIVSGLVYVPRYAGATRVFVPHTWVQAWLDDRWVSYDSAARRFDATHIALATGDGDPWRFFSTLDALGSITIRRADTPFNPMNLMPTPDIRQPEPYRPPTNPVGGAGGRGG